MPNRDAARKYETAMFFDGAGFLAKYWVNAIVENRTKRGVCDLLYVKLVRTSQVSRVNEREEAVRYAA